MGVVRLTVCVRPVISCVGKAENACQSGRSFSVSALLKEKERTVVEVSMKVNNIYDVQINKLIMEIFN